MSDKDHLDTMALEWHVWKLRQSNPKLTEDEARKEARQQIERDKLRRFFK